MHSLRIIDNVSRDSAATQGNTAAQSLYLRSISALFAKKSLFLIIYILLAPFTNVFASTKNTSILYVLSSENRIYTEFQKSTSRYLHRNNNTIHVRERIITASQLINMVKSTRKFPKADLIISVGTLAGETLSSFKDQTPILFTLITRNSYEELLDRFSDNFASRNNFSAIFIDLPIEKHLAFIVAAMPDVKTVGIILSSGNKLIKEVQKLKGNLYGLRLEIATIKDKEELFHRLPVLLKKVDILLSLPDKKILDKQTIRYILISAFRQKKPTVGYSSAYVKAGALMALFATTDDMGKNAAEIAYIALNSDTVTLTPSQYPTYNSVEINYWVAQSLKLKINTKEDVIRKMKSTGIID